MPSVIDKLVKHIPSVYRKAVLAEQLIPKMRQENDPCCLATIRHYRSLVPFFQKIRKPLFTLTAADGAIGTLAAAVYSARDDFRKLAIKIAEKIPIDL